APAQLRHHGAEQHRGAQRLQRVFGTNQKRRRRAPPGPLQGGQYLDDLGAARIQRASDLLFAAIERAQSRLGVGGARLDGAHLASDVDQLLIELAAILADCCDIGFQFLLQVAAPNAIVSLALRRKSGESPSAPPIVKIVLATASSRKRAKCWAKLALSMLLPRSSSATSTHFCGISAEIAAASSAIRVAASRTRLSE